MGRIEMTERTLCREESGELLHGTLTHGIVGACYEVANELGPGFLESVYENSLLIALREKGLKAASQVPLNVHFRGEIVGEFYADLVVEEKVIVELKSAKQLAPEHQAQLINYLKATGIDLGLLVSFGGRRVEVKRCYREGNEQG